MYKQIRVSYILSIKRGKIVFEKIPDTQNVDGCQKKSLNVNLAPFFLIIARFFHYEAVGDLCNCSAFSDETIRRKLCI